MSVIAVPSNVHFEVVNELQLARAGLTLRSKYTGKRQHVNFPFALWIIQGSMVKKEGVDAAAWRSFLVELEGEKNTFRLPVPGTTSPVSGYSGLNGLVKVAASPRAKSIQVKGLSPNVDFLARGDYFNINDELKMCTAAVATNGSGDATISFEPFLRQTAAVDDIITVHDPWIYLSASGSDSGKWSLERPVSHKFKIDAVEAVEANV